MATNCGGATNTPALYGINNSQRHERMKNMEINEVIKTLETQLTDIAEKCGPKVGTAVQEAIGACKKEVPRSLEEYARVGVIKSGSCRSCGHIILTSNYANRCEKCGQAFDWQLSHCIYTHCDECQQRTINEQFRGVCEHYAAKADEIMRLHAEGRPVTDSELAEEGENSV